MTASTCLLLTFPPWALVVIGVTLIVAAIAFYFAEKKNRDSFEDLFIFLPCWVVFGTGVLTLLTGVQPYIPCIRFAVGGI